MLIKDIPIDKLTPGTKVTGELCNGEIVCVRPHALLDDYLIEVKWDNGSIGWIRYSWCNYYSIGD